jgi:hypothetical protein
VWGGHLRVILGGNLSVEKKIERAMGDGALDFDGFCWMGGRQQPTKIQPKLWDIFLGEGAQGDDDRGGCCRIVWAIKLFEKNKLKQIRRGFRRPTDNFTQQPN